VSYDIYFVRRDPGQSFADALDATEESYDGDPGQLGEAELEQWERIVERAGQLLTGLQEFGSASSRELTDEATGIQLVMIPDEVTITVPSERAGQDSVELMSTVYALARVVEDETGLEGYDPQLGEAVSDRGPQREMGTSSRPRRRDDEDDDEDDWNTFPGTRGSLSPVAQQEPEAPAPAPPSRRRWWEFWKS
jgi:hypothetical protein